MSHGCCFLGFFFFSPKVMAAEIILGTSSITLTTSLVLTDIPDEVIQGQSL